MTAPASFRTPLRILRLAMKDAGLLQDQDELTPDQITDGMDRLNDLINTYQTQGLKLWLNFLQNVALTAGTGTYTMGPGGAILSTKPMRVIEGYYVYTNGVSYPLSALSWTEYNALPNQQQQGAINSYFVDKQLNDLVVKLWLVPNAAAATNGSVQLIIQKQVPNIQSLTEDIAFPMEWYLALRWGLADDLATGQPTTIMDRCAAKARTFREMLEAWDVEDAPTRFQPNLTVSGYGRSRFG